jgi:hypothetical protein
MALTASGLMSCARLPNQAWYIHLGGARVFKGMKHGSYMVLQFKAHLDMNGVLGRNRYQSLINALCEQSRSFFCYSGVKAIFTMGAGFADDRDSRPTHGKFAIYL